VGKYFRTTGAGVVDASPTKEKRREFNLAADTAPHSLRGQGKSP
jgi:hypothetical protein